MKVPATVSAVDTGGAAGQAHHLAPGKAVSEVLRGHSRPGNLDILYGNGCGGRHSPVLRCQRVGRVFRRTSGYGDGAHILCMVEGDLLGRRSEGPCRRPAVHHIAVLIQDLGRVGIRLGPLRGNDQRISRPDLTPVPVQLHRGGRRSRPGNGKRGRALFTAADSRYGDAARPGGRRDGNFTCTVDAHAIRGIGKRPGNRLSGQFLTVLIRYGGRSLYGPGRFAQRRYRDGSVWIQRHAHAGHH